MVQKQNYLLIFRNLESSPVGRWTPGCLFALGYPSRTEKGNVMAVPLCFPICVPKHGPESKFFMRQPNSRESIKPNSPCTQIGFCDAPRPPVGQYKTPRSQFRTPTKEKKLPLRFSKPYFRLESAVNPSFTSVYPANSHAIKIWGN